MCQILLSPTASMAPAWQSWQPPAVMELRAMLPQYEIQGFLGRGGMGAVYQGRQVALDRTVAIKILSDDLGTTDPSFVERFKNEARAMARLSHPGIVTIYDFGETPQGLLFIVMEFVAGTDVQKMISASKRLPPDRAMNITAQVCDALHYAHERGIIHRDIKPGNIMVGHDGFVKVTDFGLAKISCSGETMGLTHSRLAMGTMHYMAPETLVLGTQLDQRADIYALGVMLYHMLTGKLPQGMFELPSLQVAGLDTRYDGVIATALQESPGMRYRTAADMRGDLIKIVTQPVPVADGQGTVLALAARSPLQQADRNSWIGASYPGSRVRHWAWAAAPLTGIAAVTWMFWGKIDETFLGMSDLAPHPVAAHPLKDGWTDLISGIRLPEDSLAGSWQVINGELHAAADSPWPLCLLDINYQGGSYDLEITLTRGQGSGSGIHTSICKDGFGGVVVFDYFKTDRDIHEGKKLAGLEAIRGQRLGSGPASSYALRRQWLPAGQKKTILIQVREVGLLVKLDLEEVIRWQGDWSDVAQGAYFRSPSSPNRPIFSVGPYRSEAVYHSIRWRQVTGDEAKSLPDTSS
jgi:predicted Ser/Thr protein kinase